MHKFRCTGSDWAYCIAFLLIRITWTNSLARCSSFCSSKASTSDPPPQQRFVHKDDQPFCSDFPVLLVLWIVVQHDEKPGPLELVQAVCTPLRSCSLLRFN